MSSPPLKTYIPDASKVRGGTARDSPDSCCHQEKERKRSALNIRMSASVITPEGLTGKKTAGHHFPADKDPATSLTEGRTRVIQRRQTDEGVREAASGIWC